MMQGEERAGAGRKVDVYVKARDAAMAHARANSPDGAVVVAPDEAAPVGRRPRLGRFLGLCALTTLIASIAFDSIDALPRIPEGSIVAGSLMCVMTTIFGLEARLRRRRKGVAWAVSRGAVTRFRVRGACVSAKTIVADGGLRIHARATCDDGHADVRFSLKSTGRDDLPKLETLVMEGVALDATLSRALEPFEKRFDVRQRRIVGADASDPGLWAG